MIVLPAFILILALLWSRIEERYLVFLRVPLLVLSTFQSVLADNQTVLSYRSTDKTVAQDLLSELQDKDIVITTDLSWATVRYYLSHLNKGLNKEFEVISFPREIELHPGWKNLEKIMANQSYYEKEARELVFALREKEDRTIWILYNTQNPINEILYRELEAQFRLEKAEEPPYPREASWFDVILTFR